MKQKKIIKTLRNITKLPENALLSHPRIRGLVEREVQHHKNFFGNADLIQQAKQQRNQARIERVETKIQDIRFQRRHNPKWKQECVLWFLQFRLNPIYENDEMAYQAFEQDIRNALLPTQHHKIPDLPCLLDWLAECQKDTDWEKQVNQIKAFY